MEGSAPKRSRRDDCAVATTPRRPHLVVLFIVFEGWKEWLLYQEEIRRVSQE
jgi:hypothetical protein|eukprot:SAG25_NODE_1455_length_2987_cov_23.382964_4_plen_52_part_00